ncbi:TPA: transcriptional repressor NrdR [Candidatus Poribacteria bacterium]|nr:transcriptional repressor NrdR [Candidatus Poribacteria bacterium]HIO09594.1 transcriptional repressor NrdR [Candidatus Poribacteria bacterium]
MKCPYCNSPSTKVMEKRDTDKENVVRRRRECETCSKRFTTYERAEVLDLFIIKKDQRREMFDRRKLRISLTKACEKRPIQHEKLESLISEIEQKLIRIRRTDIESRIVGEIVMDLLKEIDEVAYIRFASVYRDFKDVTDFEKELQEISKTE